MPRSTSPKKQSSFNTRNQKLSNPDYSVTTFRSIRPNGGISAEAEGAARNQQISIRNALCAMSQPNAIHSAFFMPTAKQCGLNDGSR